MAEGAEARRFEGKRALPDGQGGEVPDDAVPLGPGQRVKEGEVRRNLVPVRRKVQPAQGVEPREAGAVQRQGQDEGLCVPAQNLSVSRASRSCAIMALAASRAS
ncbi:MAG: hypothetical protein JWR86_2481 [Enterovirga sp.]|nr:hypothetical protein [Enterovirga sp.]